jgi:hypothetical protein
MGHKSAPCDGRKTAGKPFVFHQTTENRASDKMQFFKQDEDEAKLKTMGQLK